VSERNVFLDIHPKAMHEIASLPHKESMTILAQLAQIEKARFIPPCAQALESPLEGAVTKVMELEPNSVYFVERQGRVTVCHVTSSEPSSAGSELTRARYLQTITESP